MYNEINNDIFVQEMKILWQNLDNEKRDQFADIIKDYFDCGDRWEKIQNKMQESI